MNTSKAIALILVAFIVAVFSEEINIQDIKSRDPLKIGWYSLPIAEGKNAVEVEVDGVKSKIMPFNHGGYAMAHLDEIDGNHVISLHFKNQTVPNEIFFICDGRVFHPNITKQEFKGAKQVIVKFSDKDRERIIKLFAVLLGLVKHS